MNAEFAVETQKPWAPRFFTIWTGQAFSLLGSQLVSFSVIWWLTFTTGSATILATATLVGMVPQIILGPFAGTLVDRWNRRLTMIFSDGLIALATVGLAVLFALGHVQYWQVYILLFIRSVCGGFHQPAMLASTSLLVPKEHLTRVQGLNTMLQGGMTIASAPLGALLLKLLPMQGILAIDVITATLAIIPLLIFSVPQPERKDLQVVDADKPTFWMDLKAGFRYVLSWPGLLIIGVMATVINFLLTPAFSLMPILVTKHFNGGAAQLATLEMFSGIGFIVGGLVLSAWGGFKRRILTTMLGLFLLGAGCIVMGILPASGFVLAVATMLFVGAMNPIVNGPLMASVQAAVRPDMQGRVFTLIQTMAGAMSPLGLVIAGPVADKFGVQTWFIFGGVVTISMGIIGVFIPAVMHFEEGRLADRQDAVEVTGIDEHLPSGVPETILPAPVEVDYT